VVCQGEGGGAGRGRQAIKVGAGRCAWRRNREDRLATNIAYHILWYATFGESMAKTAWPRCLDRM
jgi:hypothetical protein